MSEFIQHLCLLDVFRTSPVRHQERFFKIIIIIIRNFFLKNAPDDDVFKKKRS